MKSTAKKKTAKTKKATKTTTPKKGKDFFPRIRDIIAKQVKKNPSEVTLKSVLQTDLDADSLDALEVVFQLEEDFKISIPEDEAKKMVTVQNIVDYVTKKAKA